MVASQTVDLKVGATRALIIECGKFRGINYSL